MGQEIEKPATYIELSIHHLGSAGRLPAGPELEQLQSHPLREKLSVDWLAHDESGEDAASLFQLEEKLFDRWDEARRTWLEAQLEELELPSEICAQAIEAIERGDRRLAVRVGKSRTPAPPVKREEILEEESIPWPKRELTQGIAALLALMAEEEAPARFEKARNDVGITQEEARTAAEALEKLATAVPRRPEPPKEPEKPAVSKAWQRLWDGPAKLAMAVLDDVAVKLNGLFGPHLLTDDELAATPEYQEMVVRVDLGIGASPERIREKTLEAVRERLGNKCPISRNVTSKVAEVLNRYFENWRLDLNAEAVASIVEKQRGGAKA